MPRSVAIRALSEYVAWTLSRLRGDDAGTLDHGIEYWKTRGMIHHIRVSERPETVARSAGTRTA